MAKQSQNRGTESYQTWRAKVFPSGVADEDLSDLAADLSMLDVAAADYLIPLIEDGVRSTLHPDLIRRIQEVVDRAGQIAASDSSFASKAMEYQEYSELLVTALRDNADSGSQPSDA